MEANAFKVKNWVIVVGRNLTFLGKKFKGQRGEVIGHMVKHGVPLTRVRFDHGEALYEEEDLEYFDG